MSIRGFEVTLIGKRPLLLSNNKTSDPLSTGAKIKKSFTSKRSKSDQDHENLQILDWLYSGYWRKEGKVEVDTSENAVEFSGFSDLYLPGDNFHRCLRNAATAFKLGKEVNRAVVVENNPSIKHGGPSEALQLLQQPQFLLSSPVKRAQTTNWVSRIVLPEWEVTYRVICDDDRIEVPELQRIVQVAGQFEGVGTWRPRYGQFSFDMDEVEVD